jgi:hypothetical protein
MNYIGTKKVIGTPMSRLDYNQLKGWELPADENGADEGYLVEYDNGHQSWSPKAVFEDSYRPCDSLTFGLAIEALKQGKRVTRPSWNGQGMWLVMVQPGHYDVGCGTVGYKPGENECPTLAPWVGMKTAQNVFTPWTPAQSDQLAEDWQILHEPTIVSDTSVIRLPLKDGDRKSLFGLIGASGVAIDSTDSIDSIKLLRIVTKDGVEVAARFSNATKINRDIIINGALGNLVRLPFSIVIDPQTTNSTVAAHLPDDYPMDLFAELEVKRINYNRR